jgi:hypothetical protein
MGGSSSDQVTIDVEFHPRHCKIRVDDDLSVFVVILGGNAVVDATLLDLFEVLEVMQSSLFSLSF